MGATLAQLYQTVTYLNLHTHEFFFFYSKSCLCTLHAFKNVPLHLSLLEMHLLLREQREVLIDFYGLKKSTFWCLY